MHEVSSLFLVYFPDVMNFSLNKHLNFSMVVMANNTIGIFPQPGHVVKTEENRSLSYR